MTRRGGLFPDDADVPLTPPRKVVDGELDITPMIDVTFLLLIFFMVGSTIQTEPDIDVPIAKYGVGVDTQRASLIIIKLEKTAAGETPVILMELEHGQKTRTDLDGVRRRAAELVRANRRQFIVKAERQVPNGAVQEVARALTEIEGARFYIGVHEK